MTDNHIKDDLLLGKVTDYPKSYNPGVLQPISRTLAREHLPFGLNLGKGYDAWHVFEVSWLDAHGKPQVAIARLIVPADSPNIVESKSLKLYFNSLNFTKFSTNEELIATIRKDIEHTVKAKIGVSLFNVDNFPICKIGGELIDHNALTCSLEHALSLAKSGLNKSLLTHKNDDHVSEQLVSQLLRSNCPVTNQPDWGTVSISYVGKKIAQASLLTYLCSYREHNGFHEQCVEQIFADLLTTLKPEQLCVQAWYTRRGGLDINPCRSTDTANLPPPLRLARQ